MSTQHVRILETVYCEELETKSGAKFAKICVIADRTFFNNGTAYPSHKKEWATCSLETLQKLKTAKGVVIVEMMTRQNGKFINKSIRGVLS